MAPPIWLSTESSQFAHSYLEPPQQPSHSDFCGNHSEEVFQNVTNASVPPLESAPPLSPNDPFNRRKDSHYSGYYVCDYIYHWLQSLESFAVLQNVDLPSSSGLAQAQHEEESQSLGDHLIWGNDSSSTDHVSDSDSEDSPIIKRLKPRFHFWLNKYNISKRKNICMILNIFSKSATS